MTGISNRKTLAFLRQHFRLDWRGIHGAPHWARVRLNGLLLARETGADTRVIECFAFVHDAERWDDNSDPEHGQRAAALAQDINAEYLGLNPAQLDLLITACAGHSKGYTCGDITVLTCWDADRLDLGRVGIRPDPFYLCTDVAKRREVIDWAYKRSLHRRGW